VHSEELAEEHNVGYSLRPGTRDLMPEVHTLLARRLKCWRTLCIPGMLREQVGEFEVPRTWVLGNSNSTF